MRKFLFCLVLLFPLVLSADPLMLRELGPDLANYDALQPGLQYLAMSWSQTGTWHGVTVTPYLFIWPDFEADFYITNALGPGTTAANVLAYQHAVPTYGSNSFFDVTLGPGTYYFVIVATSGAGAWYEGFPRVPVYTAPGVTWEGNLITWPQGGLNPASPLESVFHRDPVGAWRLMVDIHGNERAIPEPATLLLFVTGAGWLLRRK